VDYGLKSIYKKDNLRTAELRLPSFASLV